MKKMKLLGMIVSVMLLWFLGEPMEAHAATSYCWSGTGENGSWYEASWADETKKLDTAPEMLTEGDNLYIMSQPSEECSEFLKNISCDLGGVCVNCYENQDAVITLGNTNEEINVKNVSVNAGSLDIYANIKESAVVFGGNLNITGNVESCSLGAGFFGNNIEGNVVINGNVNSISWSKPCEKQPQNYNSFSGNAQISGKVTNGIIWEVRYDEVGDGYFLVKTGEIEECNAGDFAIVNGILAEEVSVIEKEDSIEFYNMYQCYGDAQTGFTETTWNMQRYAYDGDNNQLIGNKQCTQEDITEGSKLIVFGTIEPVILDMNLSLLQLNAGSVTLNGNVEDFGCKLPNDGLFVTIPYKEENSCDHYIMGDVSIMRMFYTYNPNANVFIGGKVENGVLYQNGEIIGYFDCENVQLIEDGVWNENVLIRTSLEDDTVSYEAIDKNKVTEAIGDSTIGQEVIDNGMTIVKDVDVTLKDTTEEVLEDICNTNEFIELLKEIIKNIEEAMDKSMDAKTIGAVDISIDSFYKIKSTGDTYTGNPNYGKENISELPEGNEIEFTIHIPQQDYKDGVKYVIVRQHKMPDGTVKMDTLETEQDGNKLTFASDKFSTFVILEVDEKKDTSIIITDVNGTTVKQGGILGNNGSYALEGLVAGTYTITVSNENYVSRTYTVEVGTEAVQLDIELHKTGDITGDNTINARDKKMLYNHIAGTAELVDYDFAVGDVTGDNVLNARDKKMIYNHIAGTSSLWE